MTMTDPELEDRVVATLRAKSTQVQIAPRAFDPDAVATVEMSVRRRRAPVLIAAVAALVVIVAVGVALVLVDQRESTDPAGEPPSPPVSQLQIVSLPTLSYQAGNSPRSPV